MPPLESVPHGEELVATVLSSVAISAEDYDSSGRTPLTLFKFHNSLSISFAPRQEKAITTAPCIFLINEMRLESPFLDHVNCCWRRRLHRLHCASSRPVPALYPRDISDTVVVSACWLIQTTHFHSRRNAYDAGCPVAVLCDRFGLRMAW